MRKLQILCDTTIVLDDGARFDVHRVVLSWCSPFFRALFTTPLNSHNVSAPPEGDSYRMETPIGGVRGPIMEQIINYAYLAKTEANGQDSLDLYVAADYFGMLSLMDECLELIKDYLDDRNCLQILDFGRMKNYEAVSQAARWYLIRNFPTIAKFNEEILSLDFDLFVDIISDEYLNVKDEEIVWECCLKWIDHDTPNREDYVPQLLNAVRLGLLNPDYFMAKVKNHPVVIPNNSAKSIIIDVLTFIYDLDILGNHDSLTSEISTPHFAIPRIPHEVIFAIGGWSLGEPQTLIETYDTRADRWVKVDPKDPIGPRSYIGIIVIKQRVYCIGGFDGSKHFNDCSCFDLVSKTWTRIAPMHNKRCYVSVALCNGLIYAMGGFDGKTRQRTVERYDPETNQWDYVAPMNEVRSDASACCMDGKVFIFGGFNGRECLGSAECYDPDLNLWSMVTPMKSQRSGVSCVPFKDTIYVIGGFDGTSRLRSGEKFDPANELWTPIKPMFHPRSNFGLAVIDDMPFAMGGYDGVSTTSHVECYVPETNEWLEATDMGIPRSGLAAQVVRDIPNIRDYVYQKREQLMEDRRQRIMLTQLGTHETHDIFINLDLTGIEEEFEDAEAGSEEETD